VITKNSTRIGFSLLVAISCLAVQAQAPETAPEIGVVYYADHDSFKPLERETVVQSGRSRYSAKIKGAHAGTRLVEDHPLRFRVCGVDPSRFKLYRFKSEAGQRTLVIMKTNMLIGGGKTVLSESEIPATIRAAESGCFTLTPQKALGAGEFGFSPIESFDAFMFGIGSAN